MKKLLKSEICGSCKQCIGSTSVHINVKNHGSTVREQLHKQCTCPLKLKRVKKRRRAKRKTQTQDHQDPNAH